jgi:competence ComEA-like helix-hairpin-helix protein
MGDLHYSHQAAFSSIFVAIIACKHWKSGQGASFMNTTRIINGWIIVVILLVLIIIAGGIIIWSKYSPNRAIEISLAPPQNQNGEIYIGGEVNNPGVYPLYEEDDIAGLIAAAGGTTDTAGPGRLELIVPGSTGEESSQLIDINLAEAWLLEGLPGIGPTKAQAIVVYREQNGPFRNIQELTKVAGIGAASFEQIKHLITVGE